MADIMRMRKLLNAFRIPHMRDCSCTCASCFVSNRSYKHLKVVSGRDGEEFTTVVEKTVKNQRDT